MKIDGLFNILNKDKENIKSKNIELMRNNNLIDRYLNNYRNGFSQIRKESKASELKLNLI